MDRCTCQEKYGWGILSRINGTRPGRWRTIGLFVCRTVISHCLPRPPMAAISGAVWRRAKATLPGSIGKQHPQIHQPRSAQDELTAPRLRGLFPLLVIPSRVLSSEIRPAVWGGHFLAVWNNLSLRDRVGPQGKGGDQGKCKLMNITLSFNAYF